MKWIISLLLFGFVSITSFSQSSNQHIKNPYKKYVSCSFEHSLQCHRLHLLKKDRSSKKYSMEGFISCYLNTDSTYHIHMGWEEIDENQDFEYQERDYKGFYKTDHTGHIELLGKHPFESEYLTIKERLPKHEEDCMTFSGFRFRLKEDLKWITKRKNWMFCDGGCEICPDEY